MRHTGPATVGPAIDDPVDPCPLGSAGPRHRGRGGGGGGVEPVEPVARASYRHQLERYPTGELLAQPADVNVHRLAVAHEVDAPDLLDQRLAGLDPARASHEVGEQLELPGGELHLRAVDQHAAGGAVDHEVADLLPFGHVLLGQPRAGATDDGVDPGQDLAHGEGLGDVVVGAHLQAEDRVDLGVPGGEHDHRHPAALAQVPADVQTVHPGQHEVEEDQVGPGRPRQPQAPNPVAGLEHLVTCPPQVV